MINETAKKYLTSIQHDEQFMIRKRSNQKDGRATIKINTIKRFNQKEFINDLLTKVKPKAQQTIQGQDIETRQFKIVGKSPFLGANRVSTFPPMLTHQCTAGCLGAKCLTRGAVWTRIKSSTTPFPYAIDSHRLCSCCELSRLS